MKALSVKQPWAYLLVAGLKDVENRSWSTSYRGTLLIHASLRPDHGAVRLLRSGLLAGRAQLDCGSLIGAVQLVDVIKTSRSDWAEKGCYHWLIEEPELFEEPIPMRGALGLWTPDPSRV